MKNAPGIRRASICEVTPANAGCASSTLHAVQKYCARWNKRSGSIR
ncbi:MAG: hypothetical protein AB2L12_06685 [Smithellaceae bacterium]